MGSGACHVGLHLQHLAVKGNRFHPFLTVIRRRGHHPRRAKARVISDTDRSHNTNAVIRRNQNDWNIIAPCYQQPRCIPLKNKGMEGQEGSPKGNQPRRLSPHPSSGQARKALITMVRPIHRGKHDQTRYISADERWRGQNRPYMECRQHAPLLSVEQLFGFRKFSISM